MASRPTTSNRWHRMPVFGVTCGSEAARPAVLMDAPPPEDVRPFLRIAAHLRSIGLRIPAILAADEACGLVLEEDLGDDLVSVLLDRGDPADRLLDAAVDALVVMQRAAPPDGLPSWDSPAMASTASGTLFDWWWPARFGAPAPQAARDDVADALATMLAPVAAGPSCFVHRDFFAGNLLRLSDRATRDHRLPGRGHRPSGLRPRVAAAGRTSRHPGCLAQPRVGPVSRRPA